MTQSTPHSLIDHLMRGTCNRKMVDDIHLVAQDPVLVQDIQQYDHTHGLLGTFLSAVREDRISDFGCSMSPDLRLLRLDIAQALWDGQLVSAQPLGAAPDSWGGQPVNALVRPSGEMEMAHREVDERTCQLVETLMAAGATLDVRQGVADAYASTPLHRILETSYPVICFMQQRYGVFDQWAKDITQEEILGAVNEGSYALNSRGGYPRTYRNHAMMLVRVMLEQGIRWPLDLKFPNGGNLLHSARLLDHEMTSFFLQYFDHRQCNNDGHTLFAAWAFSANKNMLGMISYEQIQALLDHDPSVLEETIQKDSGELVRHLLLQPTSLKNLVYANPYYGEHPDGNNSDILRAMFATAEHKLLSSRVGEQAGKTTFDKRM